MFIRTQNQRLVFFCILLVLGLTLLSFKVIMIQVFAEKEQNSASIERYLDREVLPANRGMILDQNDEPLATNTHVTTIVADKYHLEDAKIVAYGLAYREARKDENWDQMTEKRQQAKIHSERTKILNELTDEEIIEHHLEYAIDLLALPLRLSKEELRNRILNTSKKKIVIRKEIDRGTADQLEDILQEQRVQGFGFERKQRRIYLAPNSLVHTTGYANHENKGLVGLEARFDNWLAGNDGFRKRKRNSRGLLLPAHKGETHPPRDGLNVRSTIDMKLQSIVEEELDWGLEKFESNTGAVILMEPHSGTILAIASRPHFNLNDRKGVETASFNYALQGGYEPGSTFKTVAVAGALDKGVLTYETLIDCGWGSVTIGGVTVKDHHPYGDLPVWKVIQKSSNTGTFRIAHLLGRKNFVEYARGFGFGDRLGIDLPSENKGLLRSGKNPTDFSRMSYGYAVSVTPLQVANAYCVLANGGKLMRPRIVDAIVSSDGTVFRDYQPEIIKRVIKPDTARKMRAALKTVVEPGGTATRGAVEGYTVGGKTGTAKKINPSGGYYEGRYTVSFAGMLPAENPAFVCLVVVDDPQTTEVKRYGGTIAAPIFARIAKRAAKVMNIPPTETVESNRSNQQASAN